MTHFSIVHARTINTQMVSFDLKKIVSLPSSDSYMLQNHEAGLNYIKKDKKDVSLPNDAISHRHTKT